MLGLGRLGHRVDIFSLMAPRTPAGSTEATELAANATYGRLLSMSTLRSNVQFLAGSPAAYLSAVLGLTALTWREPRAFLLSLALFPRMVHFANEIRARRTDLIHANFVWLEAVAADVASRLTGIPYSIRPHAFGLFGRNRSLVRRQLERADKIVTVSNFHREYIAELSPTLASRAVEVIHCAVDTSDWASMTRPSRAPFSILSIGRPIPKKGLEHLLEACQVLRSRSGDFRCTIVAGESKLAQRLMERATELDLDDVLTFAPRISQDEVRELMAGADAFVLPCVVAPNGDRDGIPVVLMEAMATELPVVSTAVSGIPELVIDGVTGLVVPERNAEELAEALERLMDDPDLRRELGKRGRQHVIAEFQDDQTVRELAAAMAEAANATNGS